MLEASVHLVSAKIAVVTLSGALTLGENLNAAEGQIQDALEQGVRHLVLDLRGVHYMDSAGLSAVVHAAGLTRQRQGSLRLAGVSDRVRAMLHTTRVDSLLPLDPDLQTALDALQA